MDLKKKTATTIFSFKVRTSLSFSPYGFLDRHSSLLHISLLLGHLLQLPLNSLRRAKTNNNKKANKHESIGGLLNVSGRM